MKLFYLIIKDIKCVLYDRKSLAILILMPMVLMSILGFSLDSVFSSEGSIFEEAISIGIVKQYNYEDQKEKYEKNAQASDLITMPDLNLDEVNMEYFLFDSFLDQEDIKKYITYHIIQEDEMEEAIDQGDVAVLLLPEDFVYDGWVNMFSLGRMDSEISLYTDPDQSFQGQIVLQIFESFGDTLNLLKASRTVVLQDLLKQGRMDIINDLLEVSDQEDARSGISFVSLSTQEEPVITSMQYYAVGVMSMFLLYSVSFGAKVFMNEKSEQTIARMKTTGTPISLVLTSQLFRVMFLVILQCMIMIGFSSLVLGVDWGNLKGVFVNVIVVAFCVGTLGLFISTLSLIFESKNIANIFEFAVIQFMAMIGGSFLPQEILPEAIKKFSFLSVSGQSVSLFINNMYNHLLSESYKAFMTLGMISLLMVILTIIFVTLKGKQVREC